MGVPVTASLNGAFNSRAHSFARVFGFFKNCASSRISPDQSTVANCSKSSRKTAYEVTTTSASDASCSIETPSRPSVLGSTRTSRSGVNRCASDLPVPDHRRRRHHQERRAAPHPAASTGRARAEPTPRGSCRAPCRRRGCRRDCGGAGRPASRTPPSGTAAARPSPSQAPSSGTGAAPSRASVASAPTDSRQRSACSTTSARSSKSPQRLAA